MISASQHRMRFVHENAGTVRFRDLNQFLQIAEVAVHRVNAFHDNELPPAAVPLERRFKRSSVVMLKFFRATAREEGAIAQTQVRPIVQDRDISFSQQSGNGPERAAKPAVEKHRILAPEELGHARSEEHTSELQSQSNLVCRL